MIAGKTKLIFAAIVGLGTAVLAFFLVPSSPEILLKTATAKSLKDESQDIVIFIKIENHGSPDVLLSAASAQAASASIEAPTDLLSIPAETTASLASDGAHIRLNNVSGDLKDGRTIPLTLTFQNAGTLTARARLSDPQTSGKAASFGLFGLGDICQVGEGVPAPEITLDAVQIPSGWTISVKAQNFEFTPDLADGPHVPGTGHGHIYLNGLKLGRLYEDSYSFGTLPKGDHLVEVTLNTNDHRAYVVEKTPVRARVLIRQE